MEQPVRNLEAAGSLLILVGMLVIERSLVVVGHKDWPFPSLVQKADKRHLQILEAEEQLRIQEGVGHFADVFPPNWVLSSFGESC